MARTEYLNDPGAPKANSIVVAVTAFVTDRHGRVLLVHRTDNDLWALPGGAQEIGEYVVDTAVRETREESGVDVEVIGLVGIYSNPNHVVAFSDGEVRQQFSICFRAHPLHGTPSGPADRGDSVAEAETSEARWVPREELDSLPIHPSMRLRIDHGYAQVPEPYLG
jgi:ADP-ribose pyrophosphatase YjhB (NUDIX family)